MYLSSLCCIPWLKLFIKLSSSGNGWHNQLSIQSLSYFLRRWSLISEISFVKKYLICFHLSWCRPSKLITNSHLWRNTLSFFISRCDWLLSQNLDTLLLLFSCAGLKPLEERTVNRINNNTKMTIEFFSWGDTVSIVWLWAPRCSTFAASFGCRSLSIDAPILDSEVVDGLTIHASPSVIPHLLWPIHIKRFWGRGILLRWSIPCSSDFSRCNPSARIHCSWIATSYWEKYFIIIITILLQDLSRPIMTYVNSICQLSNSLI